MNLYLRKYRKRFLDSLYSWWRDFTTPWGQLSASGVRGRVLGALIVPACLLVTDGLYDAVQLLVVSVTLQLCAIYLVKRSVADA